MFVFDRAVVWYLKQQIYGKWEWILIKSVPLVIFRVCSIWIPKTDVIKCPDVCQCCLSSRGCVLRAGLWAWGGVWPQASVLQAAPALWVCAVAPHTCCVCMPAALLPGDGGGAAGRAVSPSSAGLLGQRCCFRGTEWPFLISLGVEALILRGTRLL